MARGFIPDGLQSSPKTLQPIPPEVPGFLTSGLLRSLSGINPLATNSHGNGLQVINILRVHPPPNLAVTPGNTLLPAVTSPPTIHRNGHSGAVQ